MQRKLILLLLFCLLIVFTASQVEARPSYKQGFARSAGESAHPERWRGAVGAWVPNLGVTGGTLFGQTAFKNHGILTNMDAADWVVTDKGIALEWAANNERVIVPDNNSLDVTTSYTIIALVYPRTFGQTSLGRLISKVGAFDCYFSTAVSKIVFDTGTSFEAANTITLNTWHLVIITWDGTTLKIYINGIEVLSSGTNADLSVSANDIWIGNNPVGNRAFDGFIAFELLYNRGFTPSEVKDFSVNPLAMFELRPLVYKSPAVAAPTLIQQIIIY